MPADHCQEAVALSGDVLGETGWMKVAVAEALLMREQSEGGEQGTPLLGCQRGGPADAGFQAGALRQQCGQVDPVATRLHA